MKLFLDANVLVSVLNKEYPLFTYSAKVLSLGDHKNVKLLTSPTCIAIAFYFSCKKCGAEHSKRKISTMLQHIGLTTVDAEVTHHAVNNPQVVDLEDGIQYYSAKKSECQYIITENVEDFYYADLPVTNCESFLKQNMYL